ncbi:hypothetical protein [Paenibacillus sp. SI8]|uniref:hypothetical protein n=1 Tax=unclassified Paenibacillus TaxID=185978 RepID=UPI003465F8EE
MSRSSSWREYRHYWVLGVLLILFIFGFYGLGSMYALSNVKTKTVVLSSDQFKSSLATLTNTAFEVEAVTKLTNDYEAYALQVVDHNSVIFQMPDKSYRGLKLAVLHLDDNQLVEISKSSEFGITLTPDAKQLIYFKTENRETAPKTYIYDLQANKQLKKMDYYFESNIFFMDNEQYMGFSKNYFTLSNVTTGEIQPLISYEGLKNLLQTASDSKDPVPLDFKKGERPNLVYFLAEYKGGTGIFTMDLNHTNQVDLTIQGEAINQFEILNNGDLLLQGKIEKKEGLFLYEKAAKKFHLLQEGTISNFALDADEKRIAYVVVHNNQNIGYPQTGDLHAAYLDQGSLDSDTVIYRNISPVQSLIWRQNDLFSSSSQINKSEIFRFTFKEQ